MLPANHRLSILCELLEAVIGFLNCLNVRSADAWKARCRALLQPMLEVNPSVSTLRTPDITNSTHCAARTSRQHDFFLPWVLEAPTFLFTEQVLVGIDVDFIQNLLVMVARLQSANVGPFGA